MEKYFISRRALEILDEVFNEIRNNNPELSSISFKLGYLRAQIEKDLILKKD